MDYSEGNESTTGRRCYTVCSDFVELYSSANGTISSDFENKFVCGEIMAYADLHEHGSESAVKAAGKLRQQGKPYESACLTLSFFYSCTKYCVCAVVDGDIAYWKAGG